MNVIKIIIYILAIGAFSAASYFGLQSFKRYMDIVAINDCTSAYSQSFKKGDVTITRPLEQAVRECAWQKGVRDNWTGVWTDLP